MPQVLSVKQVTIKWSQHYDYDNIFDKACVSGIGVYCISAISDFQETIIYIGITDDSFYARLNEHDKNWLNGYDFFGKLKVRFGTITSPKIHSRKLIEGVEGGLIYQLQPVRNKAKKDIPTKDKYLIKNVGNCGLIPNVINMEEHKVNLKASRPEKSGWYIPAARRHPDAIDYVDLL